MTSKPIEELIVEIRDDPGRNPYVDETDSFTGEETVAARAWALGHEQACNKILARYKDIPEEPQHPTQIGDFDD